MMNSDNNLAHAAERAVAARLPPGWGVAGFPASTPPSPTAPGLRIRELQLSSREGRQKSVLLGCIEEMDPRSARLLPTERPLVVTAPYLTPSVRAVLEQQGVSYVDQTGNVRLILEEPGLFILTTGANTNPWPEQRRFTLRGSKAGRVVGALVSATLPAGVRELAVVTGADPGYVSRLLGMLDREAIVDRTARGQIERVDRKRLLTRWAEDAPLASRTSASTWLDPRGPNHLLDGLRAAEFPYLLTGSAAARQFVQVAPTRLVSLYVTDPEQASRDLDLRPAVTGANVILLQPHDPALFELADEREGLYYAPISVVVADLLTGPGRSPAEAEALLNWMVEHTEVWRG